MAEFVYLRQNTIMYYKRKRTYGRFKARGFIRRLFGGRRMAMRPRGFGRSIRRMFRRAGASKRISKL